LLQLRTLWPFSPRQNCERCKGYLHLHAHQRAHSYGTARPLGVRDATLCFFLPPLTGTTHLLPPPTLPTHAVATSPFHHSFAAPHGCSLDKHDASGFCHHIRAIFFVAGCSFRLSKTWQHGVSYCLTHTQLGRGLGATLSGRLNNRRLLALWRADRAIQYQTPRYPAAPFYSGRGGAVLRHTPIRAHASRPRLDVGHAVCGIAFSMVWDCCRRHGISTARGRTAASIPPPTPPRHPAPPPPHHICGAAALTQAALFPLPHPPTALQDISVHCAACH